MAQLEDRLTAVRDGWALALHGGAGAIPRNRPDEDFERYRQALEAALELGCELLRGGMSALDCVEQVCCALEDDPHFNAGRGAVFTRDEDHEFDACIVDGRDQRSGAVAAVRGVANPIRLARRVLEDTPHALLAGAGAEAFAAESGFERVESHHFDTEHRRRQLERARSGVAFGAEPPESMYGTVGCVALDARGDLASATSTGGMTNKRSGRVGDSAIVGAGAYASNRSCAISCTGRGEALLLRSAAHAVAAGVELAGWTLRESARRLVHERLEAGDGGLIALSARGEFVCEFNCGGMYRAFANARGGRELGIWNDMS